MYHEYIVFAILSTILKSVRMPKVCSIEYHTYACIVFSSFFSVIVSLYTGYAKLLAYANQ